MKIKFMLLLAPLFLSANPLLNLVDMSLKNENIQSAKLNVKATKYQLKSAKNSYKPAISIGSNYMNVSRERTISDPKTSLSSYGKISYSIYDGGKKENLLKKLQKLQKVSNYSLKNTQNFITLQTIKIYFNLLSIDFTIKAQDKQIAQLLKDLQKLERFRLAGLASNDKVQRIKSELELNKTQKAQLILNKQDLQFNLEELTNNFVEAKSGSHIVEPKVFKFKKTDALKAYEKQNESLRFQANIQKASTKPHLFIEDSYTVYNNYFDPNSMNQPKQHSQNKIMLGFSWKIYDFSATKKAYQASKITYESDKKKLELLKRKANIQFRHSVQALKVSKNQIFSAKQRVIASNFTYDAIAKKYNAGIVDNITYLDALSTKYKAIAALEQAKNDYEIAKASYYYSAGAKLKGKIE